MIMITGDPLEENVMYELNSFPVFIAMYQIRTNNYACRYEFEDTYDGYIQFAKIDRVNFVISGTFNFSTVITGCDTIRITDGRFDMQYIP